MLFGVLRETVSYGNVGRLVVSGVEQSVQAEGRFSDSVEVEPGGVDGQVGVLGLGQGVHLEHVVLLGLREDVAKLRAAWGSAAEASARWARTTSTSAGVMLGRANVESRPERTAQGANEHPSTVLPHGLKQPSGAAALLGGPSPLRDFSQSDEQSLDDRFRGGPVPVRRAAHVP